MSVDRDERRSLAYVLRLWRVTNDEEPVWRAALQDIRTGERRGFAGLEETVLYLEQQMDRPERGLGGSGPPLPGEPGADRKGVIYAHCDVPQAGSDPG
jgi:hypothetical protein